ncbi:MAG: HTTM domain-containing protein [Planctomycetota bacterium]|nr:HTTM domain-containing protein [Planctomycetota bacterium]
MTERAGTWDRFWFGESSLVRLAVFRIVLMAAAFYSIWHFRMAVFQHADGIDVAYLSRPWNPIYAFELLRLDPPGPTTVRVVYWALLGALALATVGLATRVACAVAALLTFYWIGTHYSYGQPHHDCVALMFGLAALPLAPVGARLSVDAWLARRRRGGPLPVPPVNGPWAMMPLRLVQITAALGYFFAGASKLVIAGPGWANGYTLQGIMLEYRSAWSEALADDIALLRVMSIGLLAVQTSFPLIFLSPKLRWFYVPATVLFHLVAMQTMATGTFLSMWFTLAAFVEWEKVPAFLRRAIRSGPLWRRPFVAAGAAAAAGFMLWIYFRDMPVWYAPVACAALALGAAARRRLGPHPVSA